MRRTPRPIVVRGGFEKISEALSRTACCMSSSRYCCRYLSENNLKKTCHGMVVIQKNSRLDFGGSRILQIFGFSKTFRKRWRKHQYSQKRKHIMPYTKHNTEQQSQKTKHNAQPSPLHRYGDLHGNGTPRQRYATIRYATLTSFLFPVFSKSRSPYP